MIHDIEAITRSSYGAYIELATYILAAVILFTLLLLLGKVFKHKAKKEQLWFEELDLEHLDKEGLYKFTVLAKKYGKQEGLYELLELLEPYKYKSTTTPPPKEVVDAIREYIEQCKQ